MFVLPLDAIDDQIRDAARQWVDLFAEGKTDEAAEMLASDPSIAEWPPDRVNAVIRTFQPTNSCYGSETPRITPCSTARVIQEYADPLLDDPCHMVYRWIPELTTGKYPGRIGEVYFDLPINGYWSPAVAIFFIRNLKTCLALEPHDFEIANSK